MKKKFENKEDLENLVYEYFANLDVHTMPTKAGLALYLDTTKVTLGDYHNEVYGEDFSYPIKRAYVKIEEAWVQRLTNQSVAGVIFYLKNAFKSEYKDRHETDITSDGKQISFEWGTRKE